MSSKKERDISLWDQVHRLRRLAEKVGIGPPRVFGGAGVGIHAEWSTKFHKGYGYDFVEFYDYGLGLEMRRRNSDGTIWKETRRPTDKQIRDEFKWLMDRQ